MAYQQLESDWKIFKKNVVIWRERYLAQKNTEIAAMLTNSDKNPSDQFWDAMELMKKESKILVSCLDNHSRSKMTISLHLMIKYGLIREPDLALFSEELVGYILASKT